MKIADLQIKKKEILMLAILKFKTVCHADLIFVRFKAEFRFFFSSDFTVLPLRFLFYSIFNTSDFADFRFFVVLVKSGLVMSEELCMPGTGS